MFDFDSLLPKVDIPYEYNGDDIDTFVYYDYEVDKNSYYTLMDWVSSFLESDCWAMSVNNEVLFNDYPKGITYKQRIENEWYRNQICRAPHECIFSYFGFESKDQQVKIYLSYDYPCMVKIDYKYNMKCYQVSFYQSEKYQQQNMENERKKEWQRLDDELDNISWMRENYFKNISNYC
jgi:hypothetical protein